MTQALKTENTGIDDPFLRDAAGRNMIRLTDIAHNPDEMVERCRPNAQASQLLQEYCQRIIDTHPDDGIKVMAQGVRTALRANVRFEVAYRWHTQLLKPENKNLTLARFTEVYGLAILAYHTGNAVLHNGMVISNKYAEKLMQDERHDNAEWLGVHITAVSLLDSLCHKMKEAIEPVKKEMPRGWSPLVSLLCIKVESLLEKSRKHFDNNVNAEIFTTYPFAAREWMNEDISGTLHCESIIYDHFAKKTPITAKALVIAMQKQKESIPHVKAYIYMILYIAKGIIEKASALEKTWDEAKLIDKPQKASFKKDWQGIMDQGVLVRNCLCSGKKDLTITGEFATMAEEKCEEMLSDIIKRLPYQIIRHADMTVIVQYTDFALAQIMLRLRRKEPLPLSWAICLRKIMGTKSNFRKCIGQMRNPKLLPDIPTDDPIDAGEYVTDVMSTFQDVRLGPDDNGEIQVVVQQPGKEVRTAFGRIILLRYYMLSNEWGKPDWIPADQKKRNLDELTRRLYKDRLVLSDDNLAWLYYIGGSMAGMTRMLKDVGPMGNKTRRLLTKMHLKDILDRCNENVIATYRKRGYEIPIGLGNVFLQELAYLGKANEKK